MSKDILEVLKGANIIDHTGIAIISVILENFDESNLISIGSREKKPKYFTNRVDKIFKF